MQDRRQIIHRGYAVIAATVNGRPSAAVYRGPGNMLRRLEAEGIDDVIAEAVGWIDQRREAYVAARVLPGGNRTAVASAEEFGEALDLLELSRPEAAMLAAHARAEDLRLTAAELARAGGYADFSAANLHYGLLGRRFAEAMDLAPIAQRDDGSRIWTTALAEWIAGGQDEKVAIWRMHDPLAEALASRGLA